MKVGVCFGGRSVEHDISIVSATSVVNALQEKQHDCVLIGIDKQGGWHLMESVTSPDDKSAPSQELMQEIMLVPGGGKQKSLYLPKQQKYVPVDLIFPVLHGSHGEDGRVQGVLDTCSLPYIGAGIVPSVLTNDKDVTKRLLREANIATAEYFTCRKTKDDLYAALLNKDKNIISKYYKQISAKLNTPFWVKPANLGSSLGISQVTDEESFVKALLDAFALDDKVIMEEHIDGREMECSVLEDASGITVSLPGEITLNSRLFYDYDAKYVDKDAASLSVPADVSAAIANKIKDIAEQVFKLLEVRHIMRLDIFVTKEDDIVVNEVQTIPGFTSISMYPKLLDHAGIPLPELLDRLVSSVKH